MGDTGLLSYKSNVLPQYVFSKDERFCGFKGSLTENYVANALVSNHLNIYYWEDNGKNEVDFVYQSKSGDIVPVEVKSSDRVRSKSLMTFMKRYEITQGIRISTKNFGLENSIKSVPLYSVFCIE